MAVNEVPIDETAHVTGTERRAATPSVHDDHWASALNAEEFRTTRDARYRANVWLAVRVIAVLIGLFYGAGTLIPAAGEAVSGRNAPENSIPQDPFCTGASRTTALDRP